jgi:hypothetical protein
VSRFDAFSLDERSFLATCLQVPTLSLEERERELKASLGEEIARNPLQQWGGGPIGYGSKIRFGEATYQL